jgi:hypothetical protein
MIMTTPPVFDILSNVIGEDAARKAIAALDKAAAEIRGEHRNVRAAIIFEHPEAQEVHAWAKIVTKCEREID